MSQIEDKEAHLKDRLQEVLNTHKLDAELNFISRLSTDLSIDINTCAAALLKLIKATEQSAPLQNNNPKQAAPAKKNSSSLTIKMVRYRLNVGSEHAINIEQLKETLIEESGVDKNNINNINIQKTYTLIELPDEMPPDIFLHLKSVEINQCKLDIKRLKPRNNKRRGNNHFRRNRKPDNNIDTHKTKSVNSNINQNTN